MRDTIRILMQAAPSHQNHEKISHALLEIKVRFQNFEINFIKLKKQKVKEFKIYIYLGCFDDSRFKNLDFIKRQ